MAKLYFHYGTMNSGKSIELLKVAHNYEELGLKPLLMTSALDTRDGVGYISSRIGLKRKALAINNDADLLEMIADELENQKYDVVLIDEAQFLNTQQVYNLCKIVDGYKLPVMAYGLKNDALGDLFEGSKELLIWADKLVEIRTLCAKCNKKAVSNLRLLNDKPFFHGDQVQIGGNESYISVCRDHYWMALNAAAWEEAKEAAE